MTGWLAEAALPIGLTMAGLVLLVAGLCIGANEYFKRHGLPDDEGDDL